MFNEEDHGFNSTETIVIGGGNSNISLSDYSSLSYPGKPGYKPSLYI